MAYTAVNPYISVEELCEELKIPVPGASDTNPSTDELMRAIDRASRWVDEYTHRDYFFHDFTTDPIIFDQFSDGVYVDGNGRTIVFLPYSPIISVSEISVSGTVQVVGDHYSVGARGQDGVIYATSGWALGSGQTIAIKGTFGYSQGVTPDHSSVPVGLPGKVTIATRLVAAAFSGHNRKEFMGLDGSKETVINTEIPKTVFKMLGAQMPILV